MPNNFHAQHNYVAYFVGLEGSKFTSKSGGAAENDVNQQFPGGGQTPENIIGPTTISEVQLSKPYDHIKDAALDAWANAWDKGDREELTLIVEQVDAEGVPVGKTDTYIGCAKRSYSQPDVEAGSSETAMLEVTVQPRRKE